MARLTLTNDEDICKLILDQDRKAGFNDFTKSMHDGVWLTIHRKKRNHIYNYHQLPNGDFVACVGTLIYKNYFAEEALQAIYDDFSGDIEALRKGTLGNYLVALKRNSKIYIFVDKYEVLYTYYFIGGNKWVISNSLRAVASAVARIQKLKVNELALIENVFTSAVIGRDTIFKDVQKLLGSEYMLIDGKEMSIKKRNIFYKNLIEWDNKDCSVDSMAQEFKNMLEKRINTVIKIFGDDIGLLSTGGLDNRAILAAFLGLDRRIKIFYGIGNSCLTNTKTQDLKINEIYAKRFKLELNLMNWSNDNDNYDSHFDEAFQKYGFHALVYGASKGFFDEFNTGLLGSLSFIIPGGYFGETYRNRSWVEEYDQGDFSVDEFLEDFYLGNQHIPGGKTSLKEAYPSYEKLYNYIKDKFIENAYIYGIESNDNVYKLDYFQVFYDSWFRDAHSHLVNISNLFTCSFSIYSAYDLH